MGRRKWIILGGLALITCLIMGRAFLRNRSPAVQLPDGSIMRFAGFSYGTNAYIHGNLFQKTFARWIPQKGWNLAGLKVPPPQYFPLSGDYADEPALYFLIETAGKTPIDIMDLTQRYRVTAIDREGKSYRNRFREHVRSINPKEDLAMVLFDSFPRSEPRLRLRLESFDANGFSETLAQFTVPNPMRTVLAAWNGEPKPFPQTNSTPEFDLILDFLRVYEIFAVHTSAQWKTAGGSNLVTKNPLYTSTLGLRMKQDQAKSSQRWQIDRCLVFDRFSNRMEVKSMSGKLIIPQRPAGFTWTGNLHPEEPWRIELVLGSNASQVPAEELITFTGLTMTPDKLMRALPVTLTNAHGVRITAKWGWEGIEVNLLDRPREHTLRFAKAVYGGTSQVQERKSQDGRSVFFNAPKGTNADVQVCVAKQMIFEFIGKPTLVEANEKK